MKHGIIKSLAIALLAGFAVSCSESGENEPQPKAEPPQRTRTPVRRARK